MIGKLRKHSKKLNESKLVPARGERSVHLNQRMARNNNAIETSQKTLDLAGQELRVLHQISQSISSTLNLDQVLRQIVDLVIDVTHGDACLVYLLDEEGENLVLRAS